MTDPRNKYESVFAGWLGAKHAFSFWKGRVALYAILRAMGIGAGDEVILPGYTCVMDVNPIMYVGAKAIYVDIEPETFNIDVNLLESKITPQTRAIIAQHTYGYSADLGAILAIASRRGIEVIEDCCLSLGSRYKGKLTGTFAPAAYFSTQWNKTYTTGLGGMAICNTDELAAKVRHICNMEMKGVPLSNSALLAIQLVLYNVAVYPQTTTTVRKIFRWLSKKGAVIGSSSMEEKESTGMPEDFFMGLSRTQASFGLRQLCRLEENIKHRKKLTALYDRLLAERGWKVTRPPENTEPVLVRYPVRITNKWGSLEKARERGIELGAWFESPLHPKETRLELFGYRQGMCPVAEKAAQEVVNLPVHPRVSERTVRQTIEFITEYQQASW